MEFSYLLIVNKFIWVMGGKQNQKPPSNSGGKNLEEAVRGFQSLWGEPPFL